jgi:hypothetical protein
MSVATMSSITAEPIEEPRTQAAMSPLASTPSDQTTVSSERSLASTQASRMQLSASSPQSSVSYPSYPEHLRSPSNVGSSVLKTICCRPGTATPSLMPHAISRLPVRAGATLPRRFKLRPGWGKKHHAPSDTDAKSVASTHFTFESRLPTLSSQSCTSSAARSSPLLNPAPLSSMIRRAPHSITTLSTPSLPHALTRSPAPPIPTHSPLSIKAPVPLNPTLHALLSVTRLSDLPLRSPLDVQHINALLLDVARDRDGPHAPWPRVTLQQEQDGGDGEAPLKIVLGESREATLERVRARLRRVDEGARREVFERWGSEREEHLGGSERGVRSVQSLLDSGSGSSRENGKRVRWADEEGQGTVSGRLATLIETRRSAGEELDVELEIVARAVGEEEMTEDERFEDANEQ